MSSIAIYESMASLPLFRGITYSRLQEIVGTMRLSFLKYLPGELIHSEGDPCTHIKFVMKGAVRVVINDESGRFGVSQTLNGPNVISPDFLFGRHTLYPGMAMAIDTVSVMQMEKNDFVGLLMKDEVILYNFANLLSTNAQKAVDGVLALTSGSLEERIAFWIIALTQSTAENIVLSARQRDLYTLFGVQRSSLTAALDGMKELGLIDYSASEIWVISRKKLRGLLLRLPD